MRNISFPKARTTRLVIQQTGHETLVYDLNTNTAYCLNEAAAFVWDRCDGHSSVADISKSASEAFGAGSGLEFVECALAELFGHGLLVEDVSSYESQVTSRREMLKRAAAASAAVLPVIITLVAPQNAYAHTSCLCISPLNCIGQPGCPSGPTTCSPIGACVPRTGTITVATG